MSGRDGQAGYDAQRTRVRLPLLDRLTDLDPDTLSERPMQPAAALEGLRNSVRADLEALLNARRRWRSWDPGFQELAVSPLGYGLPDFASGAFNDPARREAFRREIEDTIRRFEPRFAAVTVVVLPEQGLLRNDLRLRIEALLHAEPAPEPITFGTLIDPATTDVTVTLQEA